MSTPKQMERKLRVLLRTKGEIHQPGRLVGHLINELGETSDRTGRAGHAIETALSSMERQQLVKVERSGKVLNSVTWLGTDQGRQLSVQAWRERTFARGVPSYLPDALCSPVEIRYAEGRQPASVPGQEIPMKVVPGKTPYYKVLDACLQALRKAANAKGIGENLSIRRILMEQVGLTSSQAQAAMVYLSGMHLYDAKMTGFRQSTYIVDLETKKVTPQMVLDYRESRKSPASDSGRVTAMEVQAESPNTAESPAQIGDELAALADIVEAQEAALGKLTEERDTLRQRVSELEETLAERDAALARQETELSELRQTKAAAQAASQARAKAILARYGVDPTS